MIRSVIIGASWHSSSSLSADRPANYNRLGSEPTTLENVAMMTFEHFRRVALSMPEASEAEHMGHPDFRVNGKIFATLWPDEQWGMVKLTPDQQRKLVSANPAVFVPVKGTWGDRGATQVHLDSIDKPTLRRAIVTAWCNTAPKRLVKESGLAEEG
jgi:hypothetical protein